MTENRQKEVESSRENEIKTDAGKIQAWKFKTEVFQD